MLTALHGFTIEVRKEQNEVEHGITVEEILKKRRKVAVEKMAQLYKRNRKKLTNKEKEHFQMPQMIRRKHSVEMIELWVTQAELLFSRHKEKHQTKIDIWTTRRQPEKSWKERLKQMEGGNKGGKYDSKKRTIEEKQYRGGHYL